MTFNVILRVSWEKYPKVVKLIGSNKLLGSFPIIRKKFFKDLVENIDRRRNYWAEGGLMGVQISGKNYDPHEWIFLAATDFKDRIFHILFSRSYSMGGNGMMAAVGPPEFAEFIRAMGKQGIAAVLSLLNDPEKIKTLAVVVTPPKTAKQVVRERRLREDFLRFKQWVDTLKATPNKEGLWFPSHEPVCPVCHTRMLGFADIRVGFVKMLCPNCGKEINKKYK